MNDPCPPVARLKKIMINLARRTLQDLSASRRGAQISPRMEFVVNEGSGISPKLNMVRTLPCTKRALAVVS
jgi:hypothetical protein